MLEIQTYLLTPGNSLETLARDYAIKQRVNELLDVVSLNYDAIASDVSIPMVGECRALILELGTWRVMSMPFRRFFNYEENRCPQFNWEKFDTWEKLDGSLISFWSHKEGWQVSTRSNPTGSNTYDECPETFRELVERTLREMGTSLEEVTQYFVPECSYAMELQTPETQVVTRVVDRCLSLLAVRNRETLQEVHVHDWHKIYKTFPLPIVQHYPGFTLDAVKEAVQGRNPLEHEGYVLMDDQFNRIKMKSSAYVLMSSRRDSLAKSNRARCELIQLGQDDDVMGILPVFLQERITDLKARMSRFSKEIDSDYLKFKHIVDQKEFALRVIKESIHAPAMFALRKGFVESGIEYVREARPASILKWVNVKDDDEEESVWIG